MEKDQNINTENQSTEPKEVKSEDQSINIESHNTEPKEAEKNASVKGLCFQNCSRTGCNRGTNCKGDHTESTAPLDAVNECDHLQLVMAIFGGFKGAPVEYSPNQITTTLRTLTDKLKKMRDRYKDNPIKKTWEP
jgi:hypothetical protein